MLIITLPFHFFLLGIISFGSEDGCKPFLHKKIMSFIYKTLKGVNLYIGRNDDGRNTNFLKKCNIRWVVQADGNENPPRETGGMGIMYHIICIADQPEEDIFDYFEESNAFIAEAKSGDGVLVHCWAGISRSTTLTIAFLLSIGCGNLKTCYALVKRGRPIMRPNLGFLRQLNGFELSLGRKWGSRRFVIEKIASAFHKKNPAHSIDFVKKVVAYYYLKPWDEFCIEVRDEVCPPIKLLWKIKT